MPSVVVDDREYRSAVISAIKEAGCSVVRSRLEVADYLAGGVAFERKSADDLVSSIVDGRLFEQVVELRRSYERAALVVEGDLWRVLGRRSVRVEAVLGALGSVARLGVSVIPTPNALGTGRLLCYVARQEEREGQGIRVAKRRPHTVGEAQVRLLASLPGIGVKRAEEILAKFSTPLNALVNYRKWSLIGVPDAIIDKVGLVLEGGDRNRNLVLD